TRGFRRAVRQDTTAAGCLLRLYRRSQARDRGFRLPTANPADRHAACGPGALSTGVMRNGIEAWFGLANAVIARRVAPWRSIPLHAVGGMDRFVAALLAMTWHGRSSIAIGMI